MSKLEDLRQNAAQSGILPNALVTVVSTQCIGSDALERTYNTAARKVANELLYRHDETRIEVAEDGCPWSFDGYGALFRLVSEAHRIRLAHLFDPILAVHTSLVDASPGADEVTSHLAGLVGARAEVTLGTEEQMPDGASEQVARTVTENGRTLKCASQGFEQE